MEAWLAQLERGDVEAAWSTFLDRYRRLIFATIRHFARDYDEVMDLFAAVCEALRENGLARPRRYAEDDARRARFSTWLVVVVRNLVIDRLRVLRGRPRLPAVADRLPPLQKQILRYVFVDGRSHREAYELVRTAGVEIGFGAFLRELAAVYRALQETRGFRPGTAHPDMAETGTLDSDGVVVRERREVLEEALATLPPEDLAAVRLYVVEGLAAADVARILDLPNPKAVYNRVYRALAVVRARLEAAGYRHAGDL